MKPKRDALADAYFEFGLASRRDEPRPFDRFHRHNEIELVFVEAGAVSYLFGAGPVVARAGSWNLFWGAMPHQIVAVEPATVLHWLTVPLAWFLEWRLPERLVERLMAGGVVQVVGAETPAEGLRRIVQWHGDLRAGDPERRTIVLLEAESWLRRMALAAGALGGGGGVRGDGESTSGTGAGVGLGAGVGTGAGGAMGAGSAPVLSHIEVMAQFIARNYTQSIPVAAIAAAAGLSAEYATTLFRQTCGRSLVTYVTEHRVSHAQRLLATTDRKILDIALASGFRTASRFYAAFEAACGCSPRTYRVRVCVCVREGGGGGGGGGAGQAGGVTGVGAGGDERMEM